MYHLHRLHYDDYVKSSTETRSYRKERLPYLFIFFKNNIQERCTAYTEVANDKLAFLHDVTHRCDCRFLFW